MLKGIDAPFLEALLDSRKRREVCQGESRQPTRVNDSGDLRGRVAATADRDTVIAA
jgi:hypothetical protein